MKNLMQIVKENGLTSDDLRLEADGVIAFGVYTNECLRGISPKAMRDVADELDKQHKK